MTPPGIEAHCVGCAIYESPARGQRVCPALERQIQEEAEARQQAALLRALVIAEAPGSPPGLVELVRAEALRSSTPLLLPPGPPTSSVFSDEGKEFCRVEVSRAIR